MTTHRESRLEQVCPFPIYSPQNGALSLQLFSDRGTSGRLEITPDEFQAIEQILLAQVPTNQTLQVRILVGANAYACIDTGTRKLDVLLEAGKGPKASLINSAAELRAQAAAAITRATLIEEAAKCLV